MFIKDEPILIYNVDVLSDTDISVLISSHKKSDALASLLAHSSYVDRGFMQKDGMLTGWQNILTGEKKISNDDFYESNFNYIGNPFPLGEDAKKPRESQNTGSIWFEVRNDKSIPNAYRHSTNSQPLHTDGSYLSDFPSSTMMLCVRNNAEGGETIFLDSNKLFSILQR